MAEKLISINLLPRKSESFVNQFLNWVLTIGRLLIILTEMVALGTFLYRFTLDMQIVDLHDKINQSNAIAISFKESEKNFRDIQDRLATIKQYESVGKTTTSIFTDITKMGQGKVTFKSLLVATDNAKIEVQAPSVAALTQFTNALTNYPGITAVNVDRVETSPANAQVSVSITASLAPAAFAQPEDSNKKIIENQAILDQ